MSTIFIDINDESSVKLFLDLARKLQCQATVLTDTEGEDWALLSMMTARSNEEALPIDSALDILHKV